jgi:hypothetical protein
LLHENNLITCRDAMYAPDGPWSLISNRDLRANGIHVSTTVENDEEASALPQGHMILATATAGADGLYEIAIKAISPNPKLEEDVGMVAWERGPVANTSNLARKPYLYLTATALSNIWHKKLGHPDTTIFWRMFPLLTGHSLTTADANKVAPCEACIQGKMIKRPSQWQLPTELPPPLHRLQGDVCGTSGRKLNLLLLIDFIINFGTHASQCR